MTVPPRFSVEEASVREAVVFEQHPERFIKRHFEDEYEESGVCLFLERCIWLEDEWHGNDIETSCAECDGQVV